MSPLLVPFDDEILAHVANYWAFDDWEANGWLSGTIKRWCLGALSTR